MNLEKISQIEKAADYLEVNSLLVDGHVFIDNHFEIITETDAFKNLSPDKFGLLLTRDNLNVPSEQTVVKSLETWISADSEERSKCLEILIPFIRAFFLPSQSIEDVKNYLVKHNNPDLCHQLNFDNKTPRQGYEHSIVAVHRREGGKCLKFLDLKVWL